MEFDFVSIKEAAEKVGVTERWIQQLCKEGKIEGAFRLGGTRVWLVPKEWVENQKINYEVVKMRKTSKISVSDEQKELFHEVVVKQGLSALFSIILAYLFTKFPETTPMKTIISVIPVFFAYGFVAFVVNYLISLGGPQFDILKILKNESKKENWHEVLRLGVPLSRPLWLEGRYDLRIKIGRITKEAAIHIPSGGESVKIGNGTIDAKYLLSSILIDDLGWTMFKTGQVSTAEKNILEGIERAKKGNFWDVEIKGRRHLINVYAAKKDKNAVDEQCEEIKNLLSSKITDPIQKDALEAGFFLSMAEYRLHMVKEENPDAATKSGYLNEAVRLAKDSRALYESLKDFEHGVRTYLVLGEAYLLQEKFSDAETEIEDGIREAKVQETKELHIKLAVLKIQTKTTKVLVNTGYTKDDLTDIQEKTKGAFKEGEDVAKKICNNSFEWELRDAYSEFKKSHKRALKSAK